jgi:hypothetical protein
MDVPGPDCNSTNLRKVSLACEEVLYRCDTRAQFHGVLAESGGPGVLVGAATTKRTGRAALTAQSGGTGACRNCKNTSEDFLSFETFVVQIPVAKLASKSLQSARQRNRAASRTFGPNHEIE